MSDSSPYGAYSSAVASALEAAQHRDQEEQAVSTTAYQAGKDLGEASTRLAGLGVRVPTVEPDTEAASAEGPAAAAEGLSRLRDRIALHVSFEEAATQRNAWVHWLGRTTSHGGFSTWQDGGKTIQPGVDEDILSRDAGRIAQAGARIAGQMESLEALRREASLEMSRIQGEVSAASGKIYSAQSQLEEARKARTGGLWKIISGGFGWCIVAAIVGGVGGCLYGACANGVSAGEGLKGGGIALPCIAAGVAVCWFFIHLAASTSDIGRAKRDLELEEDTAGMWSRQAREIALQTEEMGA